MKEASVADFGAARVAMAKRVVGKCTKRNVRDADEMQKVANALASTAAILDAWIHIWDAEFAG